MMSDEAAAEAEERDEELHDDDSLYEETLAAIRRQQPPSPQQQRADADAMDAALADELIDGRATAAPQQPAAQGSGGRQQGRAARDAEKYGEEVHEMRAFMRMFMVGSRCV